MVKDKTQGTTSEVIFEEIRRALEAKGNFAGIDYFQSVAKANDKPLWTALCEIEGVLTYFELAQAFGRCSGIEVVPDIMGTILKVTKSSIETDVAIYIHHPTSKGHVSRNGHGSGKTVYLVPRDVFESYTISERIRTDDDSQGFDRTGFIQKILMPAIRAEATDIHIVPKEMLETYRIYFRILGDLKYIMSLSLEQGNALTRTVLYWAKEFTPSISIDDNRRPQDGRIEVKKEDATVSLDMRLSFIPKPNMNDRDVVIRLLYKIDITGTSLKTLGFLPSQEKLMLDTALKNKGIVLVTGPTGTGKSRTINTILSKIDATRNVLTVEDPVEYLLPNARQFQTFEYESGGDDSKRSVVDFGDFARAFKRHDPDVIFIGELRDNVTAETAFHLSKTGHLVFATLHASKATIVPQMLFHNYHISLDEIADNVILTTNQVLVKRICPKCSREEVFGEQPEWFSHLSKYPNKEAAIKSLLGKSLRVRGEHTSGHDEPCSCRIRYEGKTISYGYSGRTVLAECVQFEPEMFTDQNISVMSMDKKTSNSGNILDDAVAKIAGGVVDVDALWRLI